MELGSFVIRALETVREMVSDRGLELLERRVGDIEVLELSRELQVFAVEVSDGVKAVFCLQGPKTKDVFDAAGDARRVILVCRHGIPAWPTVKGLLAAAAERSADLEIFTLKDLQYNVSRHVDVPRHSRVSEEEKKKVMESLMLSSPYQLPLILSSDPMARYLDLRPGELVRIERHSRNAGKAKVYRCCAST